MYTCFSASSVSAMAFVYILSLIFIVALRLSTATVSCQTSYGTGIRYNDCMSAISSCSVLSNPKAVLATHRWSRDPDVPGGKLYHLPQCHIWKTYAIALDIIDSPTPFRMMSHQAMRKFVHSLLNACVYTYGRGGRLVSQGVDIVIVHPARGLGAGTCLANIAPGSSLTTSLGNLINGRAVAGSATQGSPPQGPPQPNPPSLGHPPQDSGPSGLLPQSPPSSGLSSDLLPPAKDFSARASSTKLSSTRASSSKTSFAVVPSARPCSTFGTCTPPSRITQPSTNGSSATPSRLPAPRLESKLSTASAVCTAATWSYTCGSLAAHL